MSDPNTLVLSAKPVVLSAPGRGEDLQVRVSAPATDGDLPVIVFSHGFGSSMNGYAPLADSGPRTALSSYSPPTSTPGRWASRTRTPVSR